MGSTLFFIICMLKRETSPLLALLVVIGWLLRGSDLTIPFAFNYNEIMTINKKFLAIAVALFTFFGLFLAGGVKAGPEHNVSGWAWSENIGWISFNNTTGGGTTNYGVHINTDGTFTGHAWSANIGWINFAPTGPYPALPNHSARVDTTNGQVSGWARALAHGDGWDGWIKMRGANYGVSINFVNGEFSGWAWSNMVIGWISFSCANRGVCATSNYRVRTTFVPPPSISNFGNAFTPCVQSRIPTFSWNTNAIIPYDYQIRLCGNSGCTGPGDPLVSREVLNTNSISWAPACTLNCNIAPYNNISFGNITYHGQVRARNRPAGEWGSWASSAFTTYKNAFPHADFLCDGANCAGRKIDEKVVVSLTNNSTIHAGVPSCSWVLPTIAHVVTGNPVSDCNLRVRFSAPPPGQRNQNITFTVTDSGPYSCSTTRTVEIRFPLPEYKEVPPIVWLKNFFARIASVFAGF
ncbi:MAG: hypothetical protein DDT40_00800 [candidate division WS2 bacterium]|nr:hypothetical protein [Candidatus Psychracetigena formicireducens]